MVMSGPERLAALRRRAEKYQAAVATFAHIQEELLCLRRRTATGSALDRVDAMVKLNQEVAEIVKGILTSAEMALEQAKPE